MQRYLLFDSGCAVCTRLADDIERASDGWLQARSLRDPDVKVLLDAAKPGWRWEPTLLEVTDGQPRVFTGVALRARMALGLGPRRAWRMLELVYRVEPHASTFTSKRRTFLQRGGAVFAGLLFMPRLDASLADRSKSEGESPVKLTPVPHNDQVIALVKQAGAVQTTNQHFGPADWDNVYEITYTSNPQKGYLVPLVSSSLSKNRGSDPDAAFLFVGNPVARKGNIGFVIQTEQNAAGELTLTWLTTSNQLVKTSVLQGGHVVRETTQPQYTSVPNTKAGQVSQAFVLQQQDFATCFIACLNNPITPACLSICVVCGGAPVPLNPACITCVGCAGALALVCAYRCS